MASAILNPFLTLTESSMVDAVLRVLAFLLSLARQSKHDKELNDCNRRLNDCQEKLRDSEDLRRKSENQREMLLYVLLIALAIVVVASINYRVVSRSLPA